MPPHPERAARCKARNRRETSAAGGAAVFAVIRSLFHPPQLPKIEILGYVDGSIVFTTPDEWHPGREFAVDASLPNGARFSANLVVLERDCDGRYRGTLLFPASAIAHVSRYFAPAPVVSRDQLYFQSLGSGVAPRLHRVRSLGHPEFAGPVVDLSLAGARILVDRAVAWGETVEVELQVEPANAAAVRLAARLSWCSRRDESTYLVQLEFVDLTPQAQDALLDLLVGKADEEVITSAAAPPG